MGEYEPLSFVNFPISITLANGTSFTDNALGLTMGGKKVDPSSATWSLGDVPTELMTISSTGVLSGTSANVQPGTYTFPFVITAKKGSDTVRGQGLLTVTNSPGVVSSITTDQGIKNLLQATTVVVKPNAGVNWYLIIVIVLILLFLGLLWYKNRKAKEVVLVDDE